MTVATLISEWGKHAEKIETRAKAITPRQAAMVFLGGIPFLICFVLYFSTKIVWTALTWIWSACVEGWTFGKTLDARRAAAKRGEPWAS